MNTSVCWNLTNICNRSCMYCFRELEEGAQDLDTNLGILDTLARMGIKRITFSGGEPLCYPYLQELIDAAHERGISCYLVTNGSLLNEDNIPTLLKNIDKVSFSCDSSRAYVNDKIGRGEDSYENVKNVISVIRKYFPKEKLLIDINSVITYDETHQYKELDYMLDAIRSDLLSFNINKWKIIRFYPLRGKAKMMANELSIPDDEFIEIKGVYETNTPSIKVDVRDIKEIDANLIISPQGLLKKSKNCVEEVIVDLKPNRNIGGSVRHV